MPSFERAFRESGGKPVIYKNKKIQLGDCITPRRSDLLMLTFLTVNSSWRQGVDVDSDGSLCINGRKGNKFVLWSDYEVDEMPIEILEKGKGIWIWNVWQAPGGPVLYGTGGAAMIVEEGDMERTYYCNDGNPDDDFDDVVFKISGIY